MKAGTEREQRHDSTVCVTSALDVGGWFTPRPGRLTPGIYVRPVGPQGRSGRVRKNSLPPGFDFRTVQPVPNRYSRKVDQLNEITTN
jgi:hypothetical protein